MEKEITLVIMAAGIGSRFGERIKQLEPVGSNGELIIDYSVYDAIKAGFNHVVFIIRRDIEALVREKIGDRLSSHVKISYAFQEKDDIPVRKNLSAMRKKPWGTGQAALSAKDFVKGAFAIINADDFYGEEAFRVAYNYLKNADNKGNAIPEYAMCGFKILNTLSDNGSVTRGICTVKDGFLSGLEETKNIRKENGTILGAYNGEEKIIPSDSAASMNMWCFTEEYMDILSRQFIDFLNEVDESDVNAGEFLVPIEIDNLIHKGGCKVRVLPTDSKWFGMTYAEDVEAVKAALKEYADNGVYPEKLWK